MKTFVEQSDRNMNDEAIFLQYFVNVTLFSSFETAAHRKVLFRIAFIASKCDT